MSVASPVSARMTMEREDLIKLVERLSKENESLTRSVVGLGSLVAAAAAQGFIAAQLPSSNGQ